MNAIIQSGVGPESSMMIEHVKHLHQGLCKLYNFEYVVRSDFNPSRRRKWIRIQDLYNWLLRANNGDLGLLLDADTIYKDPSFSPHDILPPEYDIGLTRCISGEYHCGMIAIRASNSTRMLIADVLSCEPIQNNPKNTWKERMQTDQAAFNHCLSLNKELKVCELNRRFNDCKYTKGIVEGSTVISAWHSELRGCALRGMIKGIPLAMAILNACEYKQNQSIADIGKKPDSADSSQSNNKVEDSNHG